MSTRFLKVYEQGQLEDGVNTDLAAAAAGDSGPEVELKRAAAEVAKVFLRQNLPADAKVEVGVSMVFDAETKGISISVGVVRDEPTESKVDV